MLLARYLAIIICVVLLIIIIMFQSKLFCFMDPEIVPGRNNGGVFGKILPSRSIFGLPILHDPNLQTCNNHLVSFIKVEGLFVPYIVHIFDTIKSRTMV